MQTRQHDIARSRRIMLGHDRKDAKHRRAAWGEGYDGFRKKKAGKPRRAPFMTLLDVSKFVRREEKPWQT